MWVTLSRHRGKLWRVACFLVGSPTDAHVFCRSLSGAICRLQTSKENFNSVPDLELNPIRSKIVRAFFDNRWAGPEAGCLVLQCEALSCPLGWREALAVGRRWWGPQLRHVGQSVLLPRLQVAPRAGS